MRRRDRAVHDEAWIKLFLHRAPVGALATVHEGQPFINTNLFVYDEPEHVIYVHTARVGRTRANVEQEERMCFSVSEMGCFLPDKVAWEFGVEYAGVVIFGTATIVEDDQEKARFFEMFFDKYVPNLQAGTDYAPARIRNVHASACIRSILSSGVLRKRKLPPTFPGPFTMASETKGGWNCSFAEGVQLPQKV